MSEQNNKPTVGCISFGPQMPNGDYFHESVIATKDAEIERLREELADARKVIEGESDRAVQLLIDHEVPFSIECFGGGCQCCASGDGIDSHQQAIDEGWTEIEPAPKDCSTSHFYGVCPDCKRESEAEAAALAQPAKGGE